MDRVKQTKNITVTMDGVTLPLQSKSYLVVTVHFLEGSSIGGLILGAFVMSQVRC